MPGQIRISAKDLGTVSMPDFCPRCFWVMRRQSPKGPPYQIFPGIFNSIDAYSKRVIHSWFDRHQAPPPWLAALGELTGYVNPPHHSKFFTIDETTNIKLTGSPDGIYTRPDHSHIIVDYKTAKFTPNQDLLYPIYETQLNVYARIAEDIGITPVTGLALIYTEPMTDDVNAGRDAVHTDGGFVMGFSAGIHDVELDAGKLPALLARTREVLDMTEPPKDRDGCKDCEKLRGMLALF